MQPPDTQPQSPANWNFFFFVWFNSQIVQGFYDMSILNMYEALLVF